MDGYLDQQVPYTLANKSQGNGPLNRLLMATKRKYMDTELPPQESEDLFQDLSQLQETWLTEAQVPDSDEQFVPDFHSENSVAFHSPPVKIKQEPQSPGSNPSQSCSHKQHFTYPHGEQCLYASAYEQKRAAGPKTSSPRTPMSPMQHYPPQTRPDLPAGRGLHEPPSCFSASPQPRIPHGPQTQPVQHPHPAPGGGGGGGGGRGGGVGAYQRQHSEPSLAYLQQNFKQEYMDPLYSRAGHMPGAQPQRYPPAHMMVKQEPTDYTYDPDVPGCPSMYLHNEGYPNPRRKKRSNGSSSGQVNGGRARTVSNCGRRAWIGSSPAAKSANKPGQSIRVSIGRDHVSPRLSSFWGAAWLSLAPGEGEFCSNRGNNKL
ncbi:hypothetical protein SKAU_G00208070 [Synaphobranchus kaupii]|uniref:PEA3-type ETS-domain transcription factor N-terminal domain-containing protein n=1 Tax=Synaphobranchus kaupii TaxID=118154 RepID=A0A9Q1F8H2_SYNKA|nr:hypothetical protein SKAU_G00208070 [Synaphobranchus kaupii]